MAQPHGMGRISHVAWKRLMNDLDDAVDDALEDCFFLTSSQFRWIGIGLLVCVILLGALLWYCGPMTCK